MDLFAFDPSPELDSKGPQPTPSCALYGIFGDYTPNPNSANQLLSMSGMVNESRTYNRRLQERGAPGDANGNVTSNNGAQLTYDPENRVMKFEVSARLSAAAQPFASS